MISNNTSRPYNTGNAWIIFAIILFVNIVQSIFTPLSNDEPYYLLYAQHLSWGYFDHPPMVALLIKTGMYLLPGEIGFRLFSVILGSFTWFFIYRIIEGEAEGPVNFKLAAILLFSSLFLNLYSFLALPDTALLCFAALFLYCYRKFTQHDNLINTAILGVVTALMLYSKYHGVLLIGFTLLSDLKLFRKRSFYLVIAITLVLLIPHIWWQIQNDYPSIRFQLYERNQMDGEHDFSYLPKQLAITGPVILLLFSLLYKTKNQFQKTLKYNVIGIFVFFFLSSFKGLVNVHWTAIAWPAMLCLTYLYIVELRKYQVYVYWFLVLNFAAILVIRADLIFNFFQFLSYNEENPRVMTSILRERAKGNPLVFENNYNDPAFFMFYQHQDAYAVNTIFYKKTQFNYLPALEDEFQGKTVSYISSDPINSTSEKVDIPKGKEYYITFIRNFASFNTGIKVNAPDFKTLNAGAETTLKISIDSKLNSFSENLIKAKAGYLALNMINKKSLHSYIYPYNQPLKIADKSGFDFTFNAPTEKGNYRCIFSIMTSDKFLAGFNSNTYTIKVK